MRIRVRIRMIMASEEAVSAVFLCEVGEALI